METATRLIPQAAFEIEKGARKVLTLSEADVARHLDLAEFLDGLEDGFCGLELGEVQSPARPEITVPGKGFSLAMPAWRPGGPIAVKIVNVFDGNLAWGVPNHLAMVLLFDADTGATLCVMDGTHITGVRTAASAVLSARMLARPDARVATIVGAGVQAREHLRLLPLVRGFDRINLCSLYPEEAERLAARSPIARAVPDLEAAVRESDVVCLATHSAEPVIQSRWLKPGTHVSSVGYHPPRGELPPELAREHRLFVETPEAFAPPPVGCAELAGLPRDKGTPLGAVALGRAPGRTSDQEITVYKAMGIAMEDMVAATLAYERARAQGGGGSMDW
ncbi:MAG: ornithine cyclodeaminase family protein [Pseudomonadota bacterium]